ncbi:MAG: fasciclin domain-containing protein [Cyanobacteria bacterium J06627_8]
MLDAVFLKAWATLGVMVTSASLIVSTTPQHPSFLQASSSIGYGDAARSQEAFTPDAEIDLAQAEFDIVDRLERAGDFGTFLGLFEDLGMEEDLRGFGRFTVFAPTDDAFADVDPNLMARLLGDRELLAQVLSYHIIASGSPLYSADLSGTTSYRTLERSDIEVRSRRNRVYVNGVRAVEIDIDATNGVIHSIDEVLMPQSVLEAL